MSAKRTSRTIKDISIRTSLNGICPYFTMFPLDFPLKILGNRAGQHQTVFDPFCGRGTTNFAARLLGLQSFGVDSSPIATAITAAKLAEVTPSEILSSAREILKMAPPSDIPEGEFWKWAYHPAVLSELCQFRAAFLKDCKSPARIALRGIILGALHGPRQKTVLSYFSNQNPRTYAPKPAYALRYWKKLDLQPQRVDTLDIIKRRAERYFGNLPRGAGYVQQADSRQDIDISSAFEISQFSWVITSPPYFGMSTYIPDQWLRNWFVGGKAYVDYQQRHQVSHSSPDVFISDLKKVWRNAAAMCKPDATLVLRFGGLASKEVEPLKLAKASIQDSGWRIKTARRAGTAHKGRRQADAFLKTQSKSIMEYDIWARAE